MIELENEGYAATFGPGSPATYLNGTLRPKGELLENYYATGHASLDNYIAQVSGQAPTPDTQADCADNGFAFADVTPGTPDADQVLNPGQVDGQGCVYPAAVPTIASQLDAKIPPNKTTHVAAWRAYEQDMGNTPTRDGGTVDTSGGTDCAHPAIGATDTAEVATPADQYTSRHNPFVWFHSVIDNTAECNANVVPLGTLGTNGTPSPSGHLAQDLRSERTTPRFGFITPNLCNDGHDGTCAGPNSTGGHVGGLTGADQFLHAWMPLILGSPAYRHGDMLVVVTFDEADLGGASRRRRMLQRIFGTQYPRPGQRGGLDGQCGSWRRPDRRPAAQCQVRDARLNGHHGLVQPLLGVAQLRGHPRLDHRRRRRGRTPRLRGRQGARPVRHRRVPSQTQRGREGQEVTERAVSRRVASWPGTACRWPHTQQRRAGSCRRPTCPR